MDESALSRFDAKWVVDGDCWRWTGATSKGYGRFYLDGRVVQAHVASYEHHVEPVPEGLDLDHTCRHRWCVLPQHVEPVTRQVNLLRGETLAAAHAVVTECPRGHVYDEANTRHARGRRYCRACDREKKRAKRAA